MSKPRVPYEVLNDIDLEIAKLYRVLRNPALAERLETQLLLTPYSREEFEAAWGSNPGDDMVEVARRVIVRHAMGFGTGCLDNSEAQGSGFRAYTGGARSVPAHDWATYPDAIADFAERLRRVVVDSRDACDVMRSHDSLTTLHYVDPPYHPSTRAPRRGYACDMVDDDHVRLLDCLQALRGFVVLSGYDCDLYADRLSGWRRVMREVADQARGDKTECLWLSPSVTAATAQCEMFDLVPC